MRSTRHLVALTITCVTVAQLPAASATNSKAKPKYKMDLRTPMLDTSVLPKRSHFEFTVKHTDFVYPANASLMMHSRLPVFDLRAEHDDRTLQGRVDEQASHSPINTSEHGVHSVFHLDLFAMLPKIAPDLSRRLQGQIDKARRNLEAEVAREAPIMEQQMARKPQLTLPAQVQKASMPPVLPARASMPSTPVLAANIPATALHPQIEMPTTTVPSIPGIVHQPSAVAIPVGTSALASKPLSAQIAAEQGRGQMAMMPGGGSGGGSGQPPQMPGQRPSTGEPIPSPAVSVKMPDVAHVRPTAGSIPDPHSDQDLGGQLKNAEKELQGELAKAGRLHPADKDVSAQLLKPHNTSSKDVDAQLLKARQQAAQARPDLDALITHARKLDTPSIPALSAVGGKLNLNKDETIVWDAWHAKFAQLARTPLLKAFEKAGGPSGANTVSITVTPDHHITVSLTKPSNAKFDQAVLQAYRSLNNNPQLEYPKGSLRRSVSFLIDNVHKTNGPTSTVNSHTSVGDRELLHFKR